MSNEIGGNSGCYAAWLDYNEKHKLNHAPKDYATYADGWQAAIAHKSEGAVPAVTRYAESNGEAFKAPSCQYCDGDLQLCDVTRCRVWHNAKTDYERHTGAPINLTQKAPLTEFERTTLAALDRLLPRGNSSVDDDINKSLRGRLRALLAPAAPVAVPVDASTTDAVAMPKFITFTGADDKTSIEGMAELSALYPIEWGILFSPKRQGAGRYPSLEFVRKVASTTNLTLSAHLCGGDSRQVLENFRSQHDGLLMGHFSRAQINSAASDIDHYEVRKWADSVFVTPILQCRETFPSEERVQWLFDKSGGRGIAPSVWPSPVSDELTGYAGGLRPENVSAAVTAIGKVSKNYWIDMETGVRDENDNFDLALCKAVCEAVYGVRDAAPAPHSGEVATLGWHELRNVVNSLRIAGTYSDEEGESTDALEALVAAHEAGMVIGEAVAWWRSPHQIISDREYQCGVAEEIKSNYRPLGFMDSVAAQSRHVAVGEAANPRYIVIGYGETDYPQAAFVQTRDDLLDAVLGMIYTSPSDADDDIREQYQSDLADPDEWSDNTWNTEFEIGGITVYCLGEDAPLPRASDAPIGEATDKPIITCDDGSSVRLCGYTGGAHALGLWGELTMHFRDADGSETTRTYRDVELIGEAGGVVAEAVGKDANP